MTNLNKVAKEVWGDESDLVVSLYVGGGDKLLIIQTAHSGHIPPPFIGGLVYAGEYRSEVSSSPKGAGITRPGRVGDPADAPTNVRPHRPGSLDQTNPAPEDVDGPGYPKS